MYNQERPHQVLDMKYPSELYVSSSRPYRGIGDLEYPFHDRTITVANCGRICIGRRKINLARSPAPSFDTCLLELPDPRTRD